MSQEERQWTTVIPEVAPVSNLPAVMDAKSIPLRLLEMDHWTIHARSGSLAVFEILAIRRMIRNAMNRSISHYPALDLWNFRGYIVVKEGMNE